MALCADDGRETKIRETGTQTLVDEDIRLVITMSVWSTSSCQIRTPFKSPCTMWMLCMYSNPFAASTN